MCPNKNKQALHKLLIWLHDFIPTLHLIYYNLSQTGTLGFFAKMMNVISLILVLIQVNYSHRKRGCYVYCSVIFPINKIILLHTPYMTYDLVVNNLHLHVGWINSLPEYQSILQQ